jgi:O-antigen/teichoic acid export membrane protein
MKKGIPGLWRKALFLLSGNSATAILTLARNLLVARMLPVADYGIAATFAITMAVVEVASALGLQQQIIQAKDGDDPRFQAALQGFQVLRGAASALILLAIAHPLAAFFGIPEVAWAYQVLAVMPVLNGFQHFDIHRMQRRMAYGPMLLTSTVPAALSLLLIWPLVTWFGDWRAMLCAIVAQGTASVLMSHLVAERSYRLVLDRTIMARNLRFGWPLLLNTVLLFFVFQGEKLIVGRELGMEALGIFAMGMTLTLTPTLVMAKSATSFFLPKLSAADRATDKGEAWFQHLGRAVFEIHLIFGSVVVLAVLLLGTPFIGLILGSKYAPLVPLLTLLAVMQGLRVLKGGPSTIALSRAQTGNAMIANLVRVALLPVGLVVAERTSRIDLVIAVGIAGEAVGFVVASWLVRRRVRLSLRCLAFPVALSLALFLVAVSTVALNVPVIWAVPTACTLFAAQVWRLRGYLPK